MSSSSETFIRATTMAARNAGDFVESTQGHVDAVVSEPAAGSVRGAGDFWFGPCDPDVVAGVVADAGPATMRTSVDRRPR